MVHGIETFRKHFGDHLDRYVIIGGTACNMIYVHIARKLLRCSAAHWCIVPPFAGVRFRAPLV